MRSNKLRKYLTGEQKILSPFIWDLWEHTNFIKRWNVHTGHFTKTIPLYMTPVPPGWKVIISCFIFSCFFINWKFGVLILAEIIHFKMKWMNQLRIDKPVYNWRYLQKKFIHFLKTYLIIKERNYCDTKGTGQLTLNVCYLWSLIFKDLAMFLFLN